MKEIKPVYYIEYTIEGNDNKTYYKKINTNNPSEIPYERNMYTFIINQVLDVSYQGKIYHILISKGSDKYAFGRVESLEDIHRALKSGKILNVDESTILNMIKNFNRPLHITPTKNLYLDIYDNYVDVDEKSYMNAPVSQRIVMDFIESKNSWYIEYKKSDEENTYYKSTYCNDKEFRYEDDIQEYRFIKVSEFEINGQSFKVIVEQEPWQKAIKEPIDRTQEVYRAIDGAKRILYEKKSENYFEGYTRIYPFNTEDSSSVFKNHQKNIKGKEVLTVTGSGDAFLDLFLYGANKVTCFDCNGLAKYYAKLKFYAIKSGMSFEEYEEFFLGNTIGDFVLKKDIYDKFRDKIEDEDTRIFWDSLYCYERITGLNLANNHETLLTYETLGMFGCNNKTVGNENSHFSQDNYKKLQGILENKSLDDVNFVDVSLLDLPDYLQSLEEKFDYMYLSNIIDFTSLYIFKENVEERLQIFGDFIIKKLTKSLNNDGVIDVGYLAKNWRKVNKDTPSIEEYQKIFGQIGGFQIESLENKDRIITYGNR